MGIVNQDCNDQGIPLMVFVKNSTTGDCTFNLIRLRLVALNPIIYYTSLIRTLD